MTAQSERRRLRVTVRGAVQGVGFRLFVYRLATGLGLTGWVNNSSQGASLIGRVADGREGYVTMRSVIGATRIVDTLTGEQLPRIC